MEWNEHQLDEWHWLSQQDCLTLNWWIGLQIPLHKNENTNTNIKIQKWMMNHEECIIKLTMNGSLLTTIWAIPGKELFVLNLSPFPWLSQNPSVSSKSPLNFLLNDCPCSVARRAAASAPDTKVWKVGSLEFGIFINIMTWALLSSVSHLPC